MQIELGMKIQIQIEGAEVRLNSILVGVESNRYMIIKTPSAASSDKLKYKFFAGNQVFVRYFHDGTAFGFKSSLIEAITTPEKLLFIEYPNKIEIHNLRAHNRLDCFLPTTIKIRDEERIGAILDINEKGCRFTFNYTDGQYFIPVHIDDQIALLSQFPGVEKEKEIQGLVKNIIEEKNQTILGIAFDQIDPEVHEIVVQFISNAREFV